MAKRGLGKGLGALLAEAEEETGMTLQKNNSAFDESDMPQKISTANSTPNSSIGGDTFIDIDLLKPNPHQPRSEFDEKTLQELSDSIKEHGIIQSVLVEEADKGTYYIIAGERRTRAARLAGLKKIPVRIQKFSESKKLEVALIENIQRENLNPLEEAKAYNKLMELANIKQEEVARRVGKNRSTVANALRLLKLPEDMQASLSAGVFSAGHARAVLSVINPSDQRILFARIIASGLSVREAEQQATNLNGGNRSVGATPKKPSVSKADPDYTSMEQQFIEALSTKVTLKGNYDKGSITIDYFSRDDLDRLYSILMKDQNL